MKISLDSVTITLSCPQCGEKLKEKVGRLKRDKHVTCARCGRIDVKTDQLAAVEREAGQIIDQELSKFRRQKITLKL